MLLFAAFASAATPVGLAMPAIFGQPLGSPPAYEKCVEQMNIDGPPCIMDQGSGTKIIEFPTSNSPALLKGAIVDLRMIDGNVEKISFTVAGHAFRGEILAALVKKFGKPFRSYSEPVVLDGIDLHQLTAVWIHLRYKVTYESIDSDLEHGSVVIESMKEIIAEDAEKRKNDEKRVKF